MSSWGFCWERLRMVYGQSLRSRADVDIGTDVGKEDGVVLGEEECSLIAEAMRLLPNASPQDVLRTALLELVERHRFLDWVERNDRKLSGTA